MAPRFGKSSEKRIHTGGRRAGGRNEAFYCRGNSSKRRRMLVLQLLSTLDARKRRELQFSTLPSSRFTSRFWVSKVRNVERVSRNKRLLAGISTSSSPWSCHRALDAEEPCWFQLQRSTSGAELRFIIQDKKKSWVLIGSGNLEIWMKKYIPIICWWGNENSSSCFLKTLTSVFIDLCCKSLVGMKTPVCSGRTFSSWCFLSSQRIYRCA